MKATAVTTTDFTAEASTKFGGDPMTFYVWSRHLDGALDADEEQSCPFNSEGWARFGRRLLTWASSGAVELVTYPDKAAAIKACWLSPIAQEDDIYITADRGDDSYHATCANEDIGTFGMISHRGRDECVTEALAAVDAWSLENGYYPSIWLDGELVDNSGVVLDETYYDHYVAQTVQPMHFSRADLMEIFAGLSLRRPSFEAEHGNTDRLDWLAARFTQLLDRVE